MPPTATDRELQRVLRLAKIEPTDRQVADRLVAGLLAVHPHPTWRRQLPALRRLALLHVRTSRAGIRISQAELARQCGLRRPGQLRAGGPSTAPADRGRTTVMRVLHVWQDLRLHAVLDDAGRPLPRGTRLPPGTVPRYDVDLTYTAGMVSSADPGLRQRAAWGWAALRADAPEELVAAAVPDPIHGERRLQGWYRAAAWRQARQQRREERALRSAQDRAARRGGGTGGASAEPNCTPFAEALYPPQRAEGDEGLESPPYPPAGGTDRAARSRGRRRATPSGAQHRRAVRAGLVPDVSKAERLYDELATIAAQIGEEDPVAAWGGLINMACRRGRSLDDLVAEYQRRADEYRGDIAERARAGRREPVAHPPIYVWRMVQHSIGDRPRPPCPVRYRRAERSGQVEQLQTSAPPGSAWEVPPALYAPEPESLPTAPKRSMAALLAAARAGRRGSQS